MTVGGPVPSRPSLHRPAAALSPRPAAASSSRPADTSLHRHAAASSPRPAAASRRTSAEVPHGMHPERSARQRDRQDCNREIFVEASKAVEYAHTRPHVCARGQRCALQHHPEYCNDNCWRPSDCIQRPFKCQIEYFDTQTV